MEVTDGDSPPEILTALQLALFDAGIYGVSCLIGTRREEIIVLKMSATSGRQLAYLISQNRAAGQRSPKDRPSET